MYQTKASDAGVQRSWFQGLPALRLAGLLFARSFHLVANMLPNLVREDRPATAGFGILHTGLV